MSGNWSRRVIGLLEAYPKAASVILTGGVTTIYVQNRDSQRIPRVMEKFSCGNIIDPLRDVPHLCHCFQRDEAAAEVREVLKSDFTNQYHVVTGEVGVGKSRIVREVVKELMNGSGSERQGAPVYVLASQGVNFVDSLAKALDFSFDEHISLKYLFQFVLNIDTMPKKDDRTKLERLLSALETAAYRYTKEQGKPAVLVIDGVDWLAEHSPKALVKLQEKAKFWADTNIVKIILVSSYGYGHNQLQVNDNAWSRAGAPVIIEDLSDEESVRFLQESSGCCTSESRVHHHVIMPDAHAQRVVRLVGGRIHLLLGCKLDWEQEKPFHVTARRFKQKERTKLLVALKDPELRKAAALLHKAEGKTMRLENFMAETGKDIITTLDDQNVISFETKRGRTLVKFYSRLTEHVVNEL